MEIVAPAPLQADAILRVATALRSGACEPWTLAEMANIANLSPFHFNRVFTRLVGVPPRRFLAALRIDAAKQLLLTTEFTVTRVCYEVGYESLGTFTTRFTEAVGVSPGRWKRSQRANPSPRTGVEAPTEDTAAGLGTGSVTGRVHSSHTVDSAVYVGLFDSGVPHGRIYGCALLAAPSHFRIENLDDGEYFAHVFAPATVGHESTAEMRLRSPGVMVGSAAPVTVSRGGEAPHITVELRPATPLDPPILTDLWGTDHGCRRGDVLVGSDRQSG